MDELNSKITATKDDDLYWTQAVGLYGYNSTCDTMKRIEASDDNSLNVAVTSSVLPDGAATEAKQNDQIDNQNIMINFLNDQNDSQKIMIDNQETMINFLNDQNDSQKIMIDFLNDINDSTTTVAGCVNGNELQVDVVASLPAGDNNIGQVECLGNTIKDGTGDNYNIVVDTDGHLQVDVLSGGSVQYNEGTTLPASTTIGTVMLANDNLGNATLLNINNQGELKVKDPTITNIDNKITSGSNKNLASVQQNGIYAWQGDNNWERLTFDTAGLQYGLSVRNLKRNPDVSFTEFLTGGAEETIESAAIDLLGYSRCTIFGTASNKTDPIEILVSSNDSDESNYYKDSSAVVNVDTTTGEYVFSIDANLAVRYIKVRQADTQLASFELNIFSARR